MNQIEPQSKYQFQGVFRIAPPTELYRAIQHCDIHIDRILITYEGGDTEDLHTHFIIESDHKRCNLYHLRTTIKRYLDINGLAPPKYKNGLLNISAVKDRDRCVSYILKEGDVRVCKGYSRWFIKQASKKSFLKKSTMTKAILKLREEYMADEMDIKDYIKLYRLMRINYRKPDPNWRTEYLKAKEIKKTEEEIVREIEEFSRFN